VLFLIIRRCYLNFHWTIFKAFRRREQAQLYLPKCTETKGHGQLGVAEQRLMTVPNGVSYLKRVYKYKAIIK